MPDLDYSLIHQARQLINGENVHRIKTWIFCYETSEPGSARSERYEKLLREFVAGKILLIAARAKVEAERANLMESQKKRRVRSGDG